MWLGWLVGVPMLFWTVSGLVMVARPIEEVRGTDLLREPNSVSLTGPLVAPPIDGRPVKSLALEARANGARWVVKFAGERGGGRPFYVDAGPGGIVARRTRFWRFYDFMWGLHIMDRQKRGDTHNPWVVVFAALSLAMVLMALVLLPLATKRGSRLRPD